MAITGTPSARHQRANPSDKAAVSSRPSTKASLRRLEVMTTSGRLLPASRPKTSSPHARQAVYGRPSMSTMTSAKVHVDLM